MESLENVLDKCRDILADLKRMVQKYSLEVPDSISVTSFSTLTQGGATGGTYEHLSAYGFGGKRSLSVLSDDSWQSALEDLVISKSAAVYIYDVLAILMCMSMKTKNFDSKRMGKLAGYK